MDYRELHSAVMDAYRRHEYQECFALLDAFIVDAEHEELARAMILKAGAIIMIDKRRAPEGLALLDEALPLCSDVPDAQLDLAITGLGLCHCLGDVGRSAAIEVMGNRLLHEHTGAPNVAARQHELHWNMGMLAHLKNESAKAYWHFTRGLQCIDDPADTQDPSVRGRIFRSYLRIADECLNMNRRPEAEDALNRAAEYLGDDEDRLDYAVNRAEYLRRIGRYEDSLRTLSEADPAILARSRPAIQANYHLSMARLAEANGSLREFHLHLTRARTVAIESGLDFMLSEIQRLQRSPESMEVIR